ncbi:MAG: hypothetical protein U0T11_06705 [Chitinophagaceae bacterium]
MEYNDWIGTIGVGMILLAYFLQVFGWVTNNGYVFLLLNIVGSGLACYASILINYQPFIVLEGVWCIVSVIAFVKRLIKTTTYVS